MPPKVLLYAETLNENGSSAEEVLDLLDPLRTRAGLDVLDHATINTQDLVREAVFAERRVELAFEGHRWNDLIRTGMAQTEVEVAFDDQYYLFPIPISEVLASFGVIEQNDGYYSGKNYFLECVYSFDSLYSMSSRLVGYVSSSALTGF